MRTPANWKFCLSALSQVATANGGPFYAAEIGCASGGNAASMLRAFPALHLWMVDPWKADPEYVADILKHRGNSPYLAKVTLNQDEFDRWYAKAMRDTEFAYARRTILPESSLEGVTRVADNALSFCFIDGDHREEGVAADLRAWWPKMKSGSIFSGHDYGTAGHDGVRRAVDAWVSEMGLTLRLPGEYPRCWYVEKSKTLMEVFA